MEKTIQVVISNSNQITARASIHEDATLTNPNLSETVKAAYPNVTDLERYALFTHLNDDPGTKGLSHADCTDEFKRSQVSRAAQRYLEYLEAKNTIEDRKAVEPFRPRYSVSGRDRHFV